MLSRFNFILFLAIALPCVFISCNKDDDEEPYDVNVDFQNVNIPNGKYNNNSGDAGLFREGIVSLQNNYIVEEDYSLWYGFAYSQMHDVKTSDYTTNEFSAYVFNDPQENKFMVGYVSTWNAPSITITFSQPVKDLSFDVANTTITALSMKEGDAYGGKKFTDSDWFKLLVQFYDASGDPLFVDDNDNPVPQEIPLAQGTQILNSWIQYTTTGGPVSKVDFLLISTDNDPTFGMRTPAYFCIDNIKARTIR